MGTWTMGFNYDTCSQCGHCIEIGSDFLEWGPTGYPQVKENAVVDEEIGKQIVDECPSQSVILVYLP
ncbi:MAG: hypothetical protein PHT63_02800 [Bacteroidales bacterium]|nr:hypothetical protein [Bacteroidales bacterium]